MRCGRLGIGHTSQVTDVCPACAVWDNYLQPKIESSVQKTERTLEEWIRNVFDGFAPIAVGKGWTIGERVTQPEWAEQRLD